MLQNIFSILLLFTLGCDRLSLNRQKDKVFPGEHRPMMVSDFKEEVTLRTLLERIELAELINLALLPPQLDKRVYEAITEKHSEGSLEDIAELVDIATNEKKMVEFLGGDTTKINDAISIEIDGQTEYTYMLHLALEYNFHPSTIELMLEKGALLLKDSEGNTPLFIALGREILNYKSLYLLLKWAKGQGINNKAITINKANNKGMTLLQYAVSMREEDIDLVRYLLAIGSDIRVRNGKENGLNALHYAIFACNIESARIILESIQNVEERRKYIKSYDKYGRTALHFASILGYTEMWAMLVEELEGDVYTFRQDKIGATELHYAALSREIVSELRRRGLENKRAKFEMLFPYLQKGFSLDVLCEREFKVESVKFVSTPEVFGYSRPKEEIIREGKENESLFLKTNQGGLTPIHYVVLTGNIELLELTIGKLRRVVLNRDFISKHDLKTYMPLEIEGLKKEQRREIIIEATPFDMACIAGKVRVVEYMLEKMKGIERREREVALGLFKLLGVASELEGRTTPLHYAVLAGNRDIVGILTKDPYTREQKEIKDREGKRAVDLAEEKEDIEILYTLITDGEEPSEQLLNVGLMLREERGKDIYEELLKMTGIRRDEVVERIVEGVEADKAGLMYAIDAECEPEILKKIVTRMGMEEILREDIEGNTLKEYLNKIVDKKVRDYIGKVYDRNRKAKSGKNRWTSLMVAAYGGNSEVIKTLIDNEASLEATILDGRTALMIAAQNGHNEVVRILLDCNVNIDAVDKDRFTALICAAQNGHNEIVATLLAHSANIDTGNRWGNTALMRAVANGHNEVVETLIAHNANLEIRNNSGWTALMIAAIEGKNEALGILIDNGASLNAITSDGETALILAAQNGYNEVVATLLAHNANIKSRNKWGNTALMIAVVNGHSEVVRALIGNGASLNTITSNGETALILAAEKGQNEVVRTLLDCKANINTRNIWGNTALMRAVVNGQNEVVRTLLFYRANIEIRNNSGWTALMIAAIEGNNEALRILIGSDASPDAITPNEETALILAAQNGHNEVVRTLLDCKANIDTRNIWGNTALMIAVINGHNEVVRTLLFYRANIEIKNNSDWTALMIAAIEGNNEALGILIDNGASLNAITFNGETALILAAEKGHNEVVATLLAHNVNIEIRNRGGNTALMIARENGHNEVVRILESYNNLVI